MQIVRIATIAVLLAFAISTSARPRRSFIAQDPKTNSTENEHPKSEVDRIVEDANKRGEHIYQSCIDNCDETSNTTADGVERPRVIELPKPEYPRIALAAHASGAVEVKVIIDTEGNVIAAASISGHPLLQAAAVNAARGARFSPAKLNGNPVKVVGVITYNFTTN